MSPRLASLACLLCLIGCKNANHSGEMDSLLSTVSYDTSVPAATPPPSATPNSDNAAASSRTRFTEKANSLRQAVVDGLKTTAGVLLFGVFRVIESALGFDDDDDDYDVYTPRGRADRNFNQWLDARERWREDD
jgi:hypothetical protein